MVSTLNRLHLLAATLNWFSFYSTIVSTSLEGKLQEITQEDAL
jgi:hypothetical protein